MLPDSHLGPITFLYVQVDNCDLESAFDLILVSLLVPGPNPSAGSDVSVTMIMMGWLVLALILFLVRPDNLRRSDSVEKPSRLHNVSGSSGALFGLP